MQMDDSLRSLKPWITFTGCVLVVAVLYWAQAILVPIALAILLTFVLTPPGHPPAGRGARLAGPGAQVFRRLHRRSASQHVFEIAVSGEAAARRASRRSHRSRTMG